MKSGHLYLAKKRTFLFGIDTMLIISFSFVNYPV
jgi:hypothetical protein